ncbi:hypothetical protein [Aporhodopirellula aestuarii]|uniref:Uncharacterized protein n=1 Tax=Aporhodopirellula aestuarii TaxID=2950107 RepID=A0ABT0TXB6_9BACT|nr:hypothetical protein [Aporhodopirellula aestuarii]MCM2369024.1 hypothetical protein [Aporhodopirellula aestuarii]
MLPPNCNTSRFGLWAWRANKSSRQRLSANADGPISRPVPIWDQTLGTVCVENRWRGLVVAEDEVSRPPRLRSSEGVLPSRRVNQTPSHD